MNGNVVLVNFPEEAELDQSAAAGAKFTWKPQSEMTIVATRMLYVEAIAAGGFSSVKPALSIGHKDQGATEVEKAVFTVSSAEATAGIAIGEEQNPDATFREFVVRPGDSVVFNVKTQGTGGTTTGQCAPMIWARPNVNPGLIT